MSKQSTLSVALAFLLGAACIHLTRVEPSSAAATAAAPEPTRIKVPFMHMRGFDTQAGHHRKPGASLTSGGGSEIEIWNLDDKRSTKITEIYFTRWDGSEVYKGSEYGLPLPIVLKPNTHYHFSSFYEHVTLPVPELVEGKKNFIHGLLADIRWEGPVPRVRGWDKGVKDGEYIIVTPITVWAE